jgi:hypothetical protein
MPLIQLWIDNTHVADLSPLRDMTLHRITLTPRHITKGMDVLREMNSLTTIGLTDFSEQYQPEAFWKKYDAGEFGKPR